MSVPRRGDQARVSTTVQLALAEAFRVFTEEIDQWWLRGVRYRVAGRRRGIIHLEGRVGGRLFESFDGDDDGDGGGEGGDGGGERVVESGRVTAWEPPSRLVFEWRNQNFAPAEKTEVEVTFVATATGTLVTVTHRGWGTLRGDHPARHGLTDGPFLRMIGLWWGDLMTSLRESIGAVVDDRG